MVYHPLMPTKRTLSKKRYPQEMVDEVGRLYYEEGRSQEEIAIAMNVSQKIIWRLMHNHEMPTRKQAPRDQTGPRNPAWRGGRVRYGTLPATRERFADRGYVFLLDPTHPSANKVGYVGEHIKVALESAGLGRVPAGNVVHHINCIRDDNRPENLVIGTKTQHGAWHASLQAEAAELVQRGLMSFDPTEGYTLLI